MSKIRLERLSEELKKTIGSIIFDMKDPRIPTITSVTNVDVTQDLKYAKVHVSVYNDTLDIQDTVDALNHASGFIQHEISQRMTIRRVPQLKFVKDDSIAYSVHISEVLRSLHINSEDPS